MPPESTLRSKDPDGGGVVVVTDVVAVVEIVVSVGIVVVVEVVVSVGDIVVVVVDVVVVVLVVYAQSLGVPGLQLQKLLPHDGLGLVPVHTHVPWESLHGTELGGTVVVVVVDVVVVVVVVGRVVVVWTQLPLTTVPLEHVQELDGGLLGPHNGDVPEQSHSYPVDGL